MEFEQCKKQAETLIFRISECESVVYNVSNAPVVNVGQVISFPKKSKDAEVISSLSQLLFESERLSRDIQEKHENVSGKAALLISQMRGQLQA
ncbi:hypothetical protein D3C78_1611800 [compost metagenome]